MVDQRPRMKCEGDEKNSPVNVAYSRNGSRLPRARKIVTRRQSWPKEGGPVGGSVGAPSATSNLQLIIIDSLQLGDSGKLHAVPSFVSLLMTRVIVLHLGIGPFS